MTAASAPQAKVVGDVRSPFQIALLLISTAGLYSLWWIGRNRWLAEREIGQKHRPIWAWLLLVVPIANLFVYYGALDVIQKGVQARRNTRGPIPFWVYGLIGYWLMLWTIPIMQAYIYHADLERSSEPVKHGFSPAELAIIVVGLLVEFSLIVSESSTDAESAGGYIILLLLTIPFVLIPFWFVSRSIRNEVAKEILRDSLRPCPWCMSSIPKAASVCRDCHRDVPVVQSSPMMVAE
jgi:hypothetical protein